VSSFHCYGNAASLRSAIAHYKSFGRVVLCTEWMARPLGSRWETDLPLLKREAGAGYSWGLVNGRTQCQFGWSSKPGSPEPAVWFHDLFRANGKPYDAGEVESIRKTTADKRIDFTTADYSKPQPEPGEVADTSSAIRYSEGWTAWMGQGPLWNSLHFHNVAGARAELTSEGTSVTLIHKVGPDCGLAEVLIDDKPATKANGAALEAGENGKAYLDTFSASVDWNRRTPLAANLAPGRHTVTIVVTGRKHAASTDTYVQIVGFAVR
jgi:hypothetical protein